MEEKELNVDKGSGGPEGGKGGSEVISVSVKKKLAAFSSDVAARRARLKRRLGKLAIILGVIGVFLVFFSFVLLIALLGSGNGSDAFALFFFILIVGVYLIGFSLIGYGLFTSGDSIIRAAVIVGGAVILAFGSQFNLFIFLMALG